MMQRIMAALKSKKHALLESPTGTGKSAAILGAALSWQVRWFNRAGGFAREETNAVFFSR